MDTMEYAMAVFKNNPEVIIYHSYNHSELVVIKLEKKYAKGMKFILSLRTQLAVLNMYSIFSVREDILGLETSLREKIENEEVSARLRMMIKDDKKIGTFLQALYSKLSQDAGQGNKEVSKNNIQKFYTLGSSDLIIEIERVAMDKLLSCYKMGNILTHTHTLFGEAVYNIETEILVHGEQ